MIHQAVSLSRYSECAVPLLHLTKLNTTFLCSGFFGFTASTRRPHPAAVPVRSARSPQPKTCIALDLQLWAWKNPLCQVFPLPQNRIRTSLWSSKRLHLRCYLWEVFLGVWGGENWGEHWTNWISIWICEVWPVSCEWSHRSSHSRVFELHIRKQVARLKNRSIQRDVLLLLSAPVVIPWHLKHSSESRSLAVCIGWDSDRYVESLQLSAIFSLFISFLT